MTHERSQIVVGIDPGLEGAIAAARITPAGAGEPAHWDGLVGIHDMPVTHLVDGKPLPDARELHALLCSIRPDVIVMERVHAWGAGPRPIASQWRFAQGFGSTLAAAQLALDGIGVHLVVPSTWKAAMGLEGRKKVGSIEAALALEDDLPGAAAAIGIRRQSGRVTLLDGRAEALLLVDYYRAHLCRLAEVEVC